MTGVARAALSIVGLAALGVAALAAQPTHRAEDATLELTISPARIEVLSGQSVKIETTATNTGAATAEGPVDGATPAIRYGLRSLDTGALFTLSPEVKREAQSSDRVRPPSPPPRTEPLAPGESRTLADWPLDNLAGPLAPGAYELTAQTGGQRGRGAAGAPLLTSAPTPLIVAPIRLSGLVATEHASPRSFVVSFAHDRGDGRSSVLQHAANGRPDAGAAYARVAEEPEVRSLALTPGVAMGGMGWSWTAWLQGDRFRAVLGQIRSIAGEASGPLGLSEATLNPVGWQEAPGTGAFMALGRDGSGALNAALVELDADADWAVNVRPLPIGLSGDPGLWLAARDDEGAFRVVISLTTSEGVEVHALRIAADFSEVLESRRAIGTGAPAAAISIGRLGDGTWAFDLLMGPMPGRAGQMGLVRAPFDEGDFIGRRVFEFAPDEHGYSPSGWVMPRTLTRTPFALTRRGARLITVVFGSKQQERPIADDADPEAPVAVASFDDGHWAAYLDSRGVLRHMRLR